MNSNVLFSAAEATDGGKYFFGWMKSPHPVSTVLFQALIGFLIVMAALAVLIGILYLFQLIFKYDLIGKFTGLFKKKKPQSVAAESVAEDEADEAEVAVAIAAAISCVMQSEQKTAAPFKIKNIKRIK